MVPSSPPLLPNDIVKLADGMVEHVISRTLHVQKAIGPLLFDID
jgi:hypothetical protein